MHMTATVYKWALVACGVAVLIGISLALSEGQAEREKVGRELKLGRDLFFLGADHAEPIKARVAHHQMALPVTAVRCTNCHDRAGAGAEGRAQVLSPQNLLASTPRRGGPATRFDRESFCKLLRTGVDPAWIVINQTMPRYELSDEQCRLLWTYLESSEP